MTWAEVAGRLASARTYWLVTTMPSGAPHAAPVWGAVTDGALHLYTERRTVKARNIAVSPRVLVHLESGEDVLIGPALASRRHVPLRRNARKSRQRSRAAAGDHPGSLVADGAPGGSAAIWREALRCRSLDRAMC